jgi:hypothetical protein
MNKLINLKGVVGDSITAVIDTEDTTTITIQFDDSLGRGIKSSGDLPEIVNSMSWSYATEEDLKETETIYNTEISKTKIWKNNRTPDGITLSGADANMLAGSIKAPSED